MKRHKALVLIIGICLVLALAAMACAGPTASPSPSPTPTPSPSPAQEVYHWKFQNTSLPAVQYMYEPFVDVAREMSDGRIDIDMYSSGELIPTVEELDGVATGLLDMAYGCGLYWGETIPELYVEAGLPFSWRKGEDVDIVMLEMGLEDILREVYAERGVYYLGHINANAYAIITTKEFHSLDELSELKLRAAGISAQALEAVGVSTTYMPVEECYLAMATGTIDGVLFCSAKGYYDMAFHEVAKYYLGSYVINPVVTNVFMNLDTWNSLPGDLQAILVQATRHLSLSQYDHYTLGDYEALRLMYEEQGAVKVTLPEEDVAKMAAAGMELWDELAEKSPRTAKTVQIVKDYIEMAY